jgi:hypothetical protein
VERGIRDRADPGAAALAEIDRLPLDGYHAFHATRADLLRRLGHREESRAAYDRAIGLAGNSAETAHLIRRRNQLAGPQPHHPGRHGPGSSHRGRPVPDRLGGTVRYSHRDTMNTARAGTAALNVVRVVRRDPAARRRHPGVRPGV